MQRTSSQNARFHGLLGKLKLDTDEKRQLISQASNGRVTSSRDMSAFEMDRAIKHLEGVSVDRINRMRRKARAIATDIGVVKGNNYEALDKWINDKWKVSNLFLLSEKHLSECITALERWRDGRIKAMVKQQLNDGK